VLRTICATLRFVKHPKDDYECLYNYFELDLDQLPPTGAGSSSSSSSSSGISVAGSEDIVTPLIDAIVKKYKIPVAT
jgi:hypothetical protein